MKRTFTYGILMLLLVTGLHTKAQSTSRPSLFDGYANVINCPVSELDKAFSNNQGPIQLSFSNNTNFSGLISSSTQRYNNLKSVVVKLNNLQGAILAISKRINDDHSISYIGRIINEQFSDGFELKSDATGNYYLHKILTEDLIQDHQ